MSEWKEYTGCPEHITQIIDSSKDIEYKYSLDGEQFNMPACKDARVIKNVLRGASYYLICNPHPLANMICQQARTGQPVYIKTSIYLEHYGDCVSYMETTTPDWNIPNAEYSFTAFKEEEEV